MPDDLLKEMRQTAKDTGLSIADAMRQSMRLGMPKLKESLQGRVTNVDPLPPAAAKRLYAQADDDEESIRQMMAAQSKEVQE